MAERGFILTPTYRIVRGLPQVHLHTVIVDRRVAPYFFVRAADAPAVARVVHAARVAETTLRTFAGEPVVRVEMTLPGDVPPVRKRLADAGVECLEADVRFAYRYLIDR